MCVCVCVCVCCVGVSQSVSVQVIKECSLLPSAAVFISELVKEELSDRRTLMVSGLE